MKLHITLTLGLRVLIICFVMPLAYINNTNAQVLIGTHEYEDMIYDCHVKSLDEFIQRINGQETYPLANDSDSTKVRATRFSLFDLGDNPSKSMADSIRSLYEHFVKVLESDSVEVSIEDNNNWVEAECEFLWHGMTKQLNLQLQLEADSSMCWRWAINGVSGLEESGLLKDRGRTQISPVDHELNFIGLKGIFENVGLNAPMTRVSNLNIDKLSYFYGLLCSGVLKYITCTSVSFHCKQIPGFYFVVRDINRLKSSNSGWLIVKLIKI